MTEAGAAPVANTFGREIGMSTIVEARELRHQDLFETPNGSVYAVVRAGAHADAVQARLWCAHPPDAVAADPPHIDVPPERPLRLLSGQETRTHYHHAGYVSAVFGQVMEQRHQANMDVVAEQRQRAGAAQGQRDRANRPWWKKLFG